MVFNTTFNNISVISWRSFYWWRKPQTCCKSLTLTHNVQWIYTSPWSGFELMSVVIGTDCIGSCKSNYRTITATWILRDTRLKIFKIYRKFFHGPSMKKIWISHLVGPFMYLYMEFQKSDSFLLNFCNLIYNCCT
jgi:hypothetical protein